MEKPKEKNTKNTIWIWKTVDGNKTYLELLKEKQINKKISKWKSSNAKTKIKENFPEMKKTTGFARPKGVT